MSHQLPLSKVKRLMRTDPDIHLVTGEAVQVLAEATTLFLRHLAEGIGEKAATSKRKTIKYADLEYCVNNRQELEFLDGALEGWTDDEEAEENDGSVVNVPPVKQSNRGRPKKRVRIEVAEDDTSAAPMNGDDGEAHSGLIQPHAAEERDAQSPMDPVEELSTHLDHQTELSGDPDLETNESDVPASVTSPGTTTTSDDPTSTHPEPSSPSMDDPTTSIVTEELSI